MAFRFFRTALLAQVLFCASLSLPASGSTIIYQQSGITNADYWFGIGRASTGVQATGWSMSFTATNVTISAELGQGDTPIGTPISGTAYLMSSVGAGTPVADQIAATDFVGSGLDLFTGLTLGPGNYYLVMSSKTATPSWVSTAETPTIIAAPGAAKIGPNDFFGFESVAGTGYAPAAIYLNYFVMGQHITVTAVDTPEPRTFLSIGGGCIVLLFLRPKFAKVA